MISAGPRGRLTWLLAVAALVASCAAPAGPSPADPTAGSGLADIGAGLSGQAGLTATRVATGLPDVAALAVDPQGRLWASTAAFTDDGTDGVYLIDGATPRRVIGDLHTPLGLAWIASRLYVASRAGVEAFGGFDGATFTTRTMILALPAGAGEVNGLAVAPDGSLALGISAPCNACDPPSDLSGAVIGFAADGSDVHVIAGGLRAPVGLAYVPGTGTLLASENQRDDLGAATPGDWLIRAEDGQDWGFPDCYGQGGGACDGVPEPLATLDAHAAVSGVAIVTGQLASPGRAAMTGPTALVAEWARGIVVAVDLPATGGGATPPPRTFLAGLAQPVGVLATAGGLFVGDWGAGSIYRIDAR